MDFKMIKVIKHYFDDWNLFKRIWILWIVVDVVSIIMWFVVLAKGGNDISILIMWVAYLVNAFYGLINWIKMHKNIKDEIYV